MSTVIPQGEDLRRAVKWISEERQSKARKKLTKLIEEACVKFDLSPADGDYLLKFFKEQ